jgi:hypothetical protein
MSDRPIQSSGRYDLSQLDAGLEWDALEDYQQEHFMELYNKYIDSSAYRRTGNLDWISRRCRRQGMLVPDAFVALPRCDAKDAQAKGIKSMECAVCLEDVSGKTVLLPCKHGFHEKCIRGWFATNTACPCCRLDLQPPKPKSDDDEEDV